MVCAYGKKCPSVCTKIYPSSSIFKGSLQVLNALLTIQRFHQDLQFSIAIIKSQRPSPAGFIQSRHHLNHNLEIPTWNGNFTFIILPAHSFLFFPLFPFTLVLSYSLLRFPWVFPPLHYFVFFLSLTTPSRLLPVCPPILPTNLINHHLLQSSLNPLHSLTHKTVIYLLGITIYFALYIHTYITYIFFTPCPNPPSPLVNGLNYYVTQKKKKGYIDEMNIPVSHVRTHTAPLV